jgi:hypothetical protein
MTLLAACAAPAMPTASAPELGPIRAAARAYLQSAAGADTDWLFAPATIDSVRRGLRSETTTDGKRALLHLHRFLVAGHLRRAGDPLETQIDAIRRRPFDVDGQRLTLLDSRDVIAAEPDPNRRRRLAEATARVLADLHPLLARYDELMSATGRRLGYADPVRLATAVRGYDVRAAGELAKRLLSSSDALYLSALRDLAPVALAVPFENLRRADLPRLAHACAREVPADREVGATLATVLGLGFELNRMPDEDRCRGGILHAVGHALHRAHTRTQVVELRLLGDQSVAEGFALLFERLNRDPQWLVERMHLPAGAHLSEHLRLVALCDLVELRTLAADLLVDLEWRSSSEAERREAYARHIGRALGLPLEPSDLEPFHMGPGLFLDAADRLRARVLAAQIDADLRRRFGEAWWKSAGAAPRLRDAWASGLRETAEELARRLQLGPLDPRPALAGIARALRGPIPAMATFATQR